MVVVQYVVVRGDLLARQGWPLGALLAQACHAATAAIHLHYRQQMLSALSPPISYISSICLPLLPLFDADVAAHSDEVTQQYLADLDNMHKVTGQAILCTCIIYFYSWSFSVLFCSF